MRGWAVAGAAAGLVAATYAFYTGRLDAALFGATAGSGSANEAKPAAPQSSPAAPDAPNDGGAVGRSLSGLSAALQTLRKLGAGAGGAVDLRAWWAATAAPQRLVILQMARELLRAHVSAGGQGSDVVDLLCPELADGKLDRLVDLLPALIHARLEDRDGVRLHDLGFVKASLASAPRPEGKGGAQPPDAYAADVLTDNRQILMNTFLSNVVALVARCASEAAGDRARGEQSRGLYTLAEGGPGEGDEEEEGRGGGAAAGRPPAGEPWKAAAGVGGAGNSSSSNRPEEKSAVQDPLEQQRLKRAFVESVEYGDLP